MTLTALIVLTLATWRASSLLTYERGPYALFEKLRYLSGVRPDAHSRDMPTTELAEGVLCLWCNSVWFGILFTLLSCLVGVVNWRWAISLPWALSAGAVLTQDLIEKLEARHG
jgi:hypothetical protein